MFLRTKKENNIAGILMGTHYMKHHSELKDLKKKKFGIAQRKKTLDQV